jgi:hypothetical protein
MKSQPLVPATATSSSSEFATTPDLPSELHDGVESSPRDRGVTPRVVTLCLLLAVLFGYIIPVIDIKLQNSFLARSTCRPARLRPCLFF